jgi:peroxiredoxin
VLLLSLSGPELAAPGGVRDLRPRPGTGKHYPTPKQFIDSGAAADRHIEPFTASADDGTHYYWPAKSGSRPLVLVFIKRDCPCNVEFEPFFRRIEERYGDVADFAGVIDSDVRSARSYVLANHLSHRVLADPERAIIERFEIPNGGYVALLRPAGEIDTLWPGCSAEMICELGRRVAALASVAERPIDVSGMPRVLTTGCPFSS